MEWMDIWVAAFFIAKILQKAKIMQELAKTKNQVQPTFSSSDISLVAAILSTGKAKLVSSQRLNPYKVEFHLSPPDICYQLQTDYINGSLVVSARLISDHVRMLKSLTNKQAIKTLKDRLYQEGAWFMVSQELLEELRMILKEECQLELQPQEVSQIGNTFVDYFKLLLKIDREEPIEDGSNKTRKQKILYKPQKLSAHKAQVEPHRFFSAQKDLKQLLYQNK